MSRHHGRTRKHSGKQHDRVQAEPNRLAAGRLPRTKLAGIPVKTLPAQQANASRSVTGGEV